ncbi:anaerobic dimethyl sulfoxide reductase subunit B (iron-sulfur subunit) [Desulfobaculum xiamenense]|uniref:Anaerobic dimethyl sulfoxide reductase subunit B (Iron-sulfur subunit) n=1 Tax=Desulfobaculum xiamenense TaxID=995050 RepID=A0A846QFK1_9BACT|nr:DMSO/selenate family reductase complex B subunit [Desulfobaculum xiamenense]NJB67566.1 anaerobic dimethyl sulfoxide reductase subunit B (iron-sulfur subunit) [Desulfobaculum xiamenense]
MLKRPAFHVDMQACTGCRTCVMACIDRNDLPEGILYRRVVEYSGGTCSRNADGTFAQDVFAYHLSIACNHCQNPICVRSCPTGAMRKDEHGIVSVDAKLCVGCRYCEWGCPYCAPQFDAKAGRMTKCDLCRDLLEQGQPPACVSACPNRALHFGEYEDLASMFGEFEVVAPLPDRAITQPNLLVTPARNARPSGSRSGCIRAAAHPGTPRNDTT